MNKYFSKPKSLGANVKIELDLSSQPATTDLKDAREADTSDVSKKTDLTNLKSDVDKLDIDKLKNVPSDLNSLKIKIKVDKLDIGKLDTTLVDLRQLKQENDVVKKLDIINQLKKLITLVLLTLVTQLRKLTKTELKIIKLLLFMINVSLLMNLIN